MAIWPGRASALESTAVSSSRSTATLITDTDQALPGHPFHVALRLRLAPGWHTYWKNPGDAGVAPEITLALPEGTVAGPVTWPTPEREAEGTLTTYAYRGDVVLPQTVTPGQSTPLDISAHAEWLVCRDVCVPESGDFELLLGRGANAPSAQAALFANAIVPSTAPFETSIAPDGTLDLSGAGLPASIAAAEFIPAEDGVVERSGKQAVRSRDGAVDLALTFDPAIDLGHSIAGLVKLTDSAGLTTAYDVRAEPGPARSRSEPPGHRSVVFLLAAAFAGGCLLNVMPCVFPILAMKALSLARMPGRDRRTTQLEAVSYTAGVVTAFVALGAILISLRQAGSAIGWGFQLQSPQFVTVIAWVLFAVGLNLSGVFAVGGRLAGTGQSLTSPGGHLGSFFTGLLAVIVASPCTAAFMGVAIAGALASPAPEAMLIFAAMGLGLATPYAAIAVTPGLARQLPRPGKWMETLRQALAFPIYASVAWLVWVVSQQSGSEGVLIALSGAVCVGFAAWAIGRGEASSARARGIAYAASLSAVLIAGGLVYQPATNISAWTEPFSATRLAALRREGRPVFVNMTAAWCISCLVNERLALSPQAVRDAFVQNHVAYLKGDWTRQNPEITAFLQEHGSDGVPLYVFYPPGRPPTVLPQLLSESYILSRLKDVGS